MGAIYNEIEPYAVAWLRNLEIAGHIAQGRVDERSIRDLKPDDVREFTQAHFFAGIGVWSHALRLAGWPDELPVWTGSCPCQPFSGAGKRGGFADDRHLWPDWFKLIRECRPPVVFGEQVASPDGYRWLDLVQADLEGAGYAFGAAVLPAAGVGAPHIRHRIYWVAYSDEAGLGVIRRAGLLHREREAQRHDADGCGEARGVADADQVGRLGRQDDGGDERNGQDGGRAQARRELEPRCSTRGLGDAAGSGRTRERGEPAHDEPRPSGEGPGPTNGFWRDVEWIACRDGKARPTEPGTFPLAHGATSRVGRLRAYGNAICAEVAVEFIRAVMESALTEAA